MSDRYEFIHLHHPGSLPGIPGLHSPGTYVIDWQTRTLHEASSLESFLASLEPDAPITPPDGQETAQPEDAAITPPVPETPPVPAVDVPETDVSLPAQPEDGTNAPDSDAPIAVGGIEEPNESPAPESGA